MRILVTGGAGFIGSHLVERILQKFPDWEVVVYDAFTYAGRRENLVNVISNPKLTIIEGDIRDGSSVMKAVRDCDAVLHLAAESHVDRSIQGAQPFITTNVQGTYQIVEAVHQLKVKKLVVVSTDECYGSRELGKFTEEAPLNPSSPYSASKAAGDLIALSYWRTHKLPVVITRGSNTLGPRQNPEKLVPKAIIRAIRGERIPVYGNGNQIRDWIWVGDHVDGIIAALLHGVPGEVYNIAGGNEMQNIFLISKILAANNRSNDLIEYVSDRKGHDYRYAIDTTKAQKHLGWQPQVRFELALAYSIIWYRENKDWWEPLIGD